MGTALITGANRGLGLEFARQYLDDGWRTIDKLTIGESGSFKRHDGFNHPW